jgi:hypothetical protein
VRLEACRLADNEAEAVVAMEQASVELLNCSLRANKGPALDVSGGASARVSGGEAADNAGGVFLWDRGTARLEGLRLGGGAHCPSASAAGRARRAAAVGAAAHAAVVLVVEYFLSGAHGAYAAAGRRHGATGVF